MQQTYSWSPRSASFWMVALIALGISFIGIRYMLAPHAAALGFGIPLPDDHTVYYGVIKGIRDLFSGLVLGYLLWTRNRRVTLFIFSFAVLIPVTDGTTIWLANGPADVAHLAIHWGTALYGILTAVLLFLEERRPA